MNNGKQRKIHLGIMTTRSIDCTPGSLRNAEKKLNGWAENKPFFINLLIKYGANGAI